MSVTTVGSTAAARPSPVRYLVRSYTPSIETAGLHRSRR